MERYKSSKDGLWTEAVVLCPICLEVVSAADCTLTEDTIRQYTCNECLDN